MKKILLLAISATLVMAGCGESTTDNNPKKPDKPDFGKLPELPDPTDVCSAMDDIEFMKYCYEHFDVNKDGKISKQECKVVNTMNCDWLSIFSFKGIEYFANLETFSCRANSKVKTIDLSHNKKITKLGYSAFEGCTGLTSIEIPDSLTEIGAFAFCGCVSLTGVYITDLAAWCRIKFMSGYGNPLYYANNLYLNGNLVTDLVIPDSVTEIGRNAFNCCITLTSVTIPNSVTVIGNSAFTSCEGLTSITIPDSVTAIGDGAFSGCTSLANVTIPDHVALIGDSAFHYCPAMTSVYCRPTTPPTLNFVTFCGTNAKIYVPRASVNAYKTADGWCDYASRIEGYDF